MNFLSNSKGNDYKIYLKLIYQNYNEKIIDFYYNNVISKIYFNKFLTENFNILHLFYKIKNMESANKIRKVNFI